eukprot:14461027-Ditylum_brightwellii.AAC.1
MYNLAIPFYDRGSVEGWLKFQQNLQAITTRQNITNPQACVNKMNDQLEQFLPRNDRTHQVKLAEDKLIDILENVVPKSWQREMHRQRFDCVVKGQLCPGPTSRPPHPGPTY